MPTLHHRPLRRRFVRGLLAALLATVSALTFAPVAAQADSHCELTIHYTVLHSWDGGYVTEVVVANDSWTPPVLVENWRISLVFADPVEIDFFWSTDYIGSKLSGTEQFFKNPSWDAPYLYPDQSDTFGYIAVGAAQEPIDAYQVAPHPCHVTLLT